MIWLFDMRCEEVAGLSVAVKHCWFSRIKIMGIKKRCNGQPSTFAKHSSRLSALMTVCAHCLATLHMLPRLATAIHLYSWCWHAGLGYIHACIHTYIHTYMHAYIHTYRLFTHHLFCHTPSFTYDFVPHNCCYFTTSFVFPSLSVPLHLLLIIGRKWHVGLSGPLILLRTLRTTRVISVVASTVAVIAVVWCN